MDEWHPSIDQLASFFGGDCSPTLHQEVSDHLRTCTSYCRTISEAQIQEDRARWEKRERKGTLTEWGISFVPKSS